MHLSPGKMLDSGAILRLLAEAGLAQSSGRSQVDVFDNLYLVFLTLGTIVGVIVISYTVYNAYKYRSTEDRDPAEGKYDVEEVDDDVVRPQLGEIPRSAKGGKKVFLSFGISLVLILGLIIYSYSLLLYVEDTDQFDDEESIDVHVEGFQFGWEYTYENENWNESFTTTDQLIVPADKAVVLEVTSKDVMHNYGVPELRAKTDAIPGQTTSTWFRADEPGTYEAICFELCGTGHSNMREDVIVVPADEFNDDAETKAEFEEWYQQKLEEEGYA